MTIALGLLCDEGNSILLAADTMISYGTVSSNQGGSKIYDLPLGLFAAVADDVSQTHIFISKLAEELTNLLPTDESLLDKVKIGCRNSGTYAFKWMRSELLGQIGLTDDEYLHDSKIALELRQKAEQLLRELHLPIEIIISGYSEKHTIFLYIDGNKIVEQSSPGVFLAGSGANAALHWLNFRQQNVHFSRGRSYAHVLETMAFAKLSPFVGRQFGALLLKRGESQPLRLSESGEKWVRECQDSIWLRPTTYLDTEAQRNAFDRAFSVKPSASQASAS